VYIFKKDIMEDKLVSKEKEQPVLTRMLQELTELTHASETHTDELRSILGGMDNVTLSWEEDNEKEMVMQDAPPSPNNHLKTLGELIGRLRGSTLRREQIINHLNRIV